MKNILTILFLFLAGSGFCQDTVTIYYDAGWQKITDREKAAFYTKAYQNPEGLWTTTDYYISGHVQMTGFYKSMKNEHKQGLFVYYYENGNKQSEGYFKDNMMEGEWNNWDDKGRMLSKVFYTKNKITRIVTYFPNGGVNQHGSVKNDQKEGHWSYYDYEGRLIFEGNYSNNLREGPWQRHLPDTTIVVNYFRGNLIEDTGTLVRARDEGRRVYDN